ncbi:MAG: hypothetical protein ABI581_01905 [Sediminibacterium sp.]
MMPFKKNRQHIFSRLCHSRNLLFFMVVASFCCRQQPSDVTVIWENDKAKAIRFPSKWIEGITKDELDKYVKVSLLKDTNRTAILGDYQLGNDIVFEPLIPFTPGSVYVIFVKDKKAGEISIPPADSHDAPRIVASYPQQDTVPENLLKIYLRFSHPMMENRSADYITLVRNGTDTLHGAFLDLQPELWNEDRTVITVWLDPGRIKRDLQPNLKFGAPLEKSAKYQLIVSKRWKDTQGRELTKDYNWSFVTGSRDSISPDPAKWKMILPKAATKESLTIEMNETLDHFLLMESFRVTNKNGLTVQGLFETTGKDKNITFTPSEAWPAGNYKVMIASRLEDLSGNNLNRPFERDITKTKEPSTQTHYSKDFIVEK